MTIKKPRTALISPDDVTQLIDCTFRHASVTAICTQLGITRPTYYKWRQEGITGPHDRNNFLDAIRRESNKIYLANLTRQNILTRIQDRK